MLEVAGTMLHALHPPIDELATLLLAHDSLRRWHRESRVQSTFFLPPFPSSHPLRHFVHAAVSIILISTYHPSKPSQNKLSPIVPPALANATLAVDADQSTFPRT